VTAALRLASIARHLPFLHAGQRAVFAPTASEQAVQRIAARMGVRLPGASA
jgi:hypothetical protein